MMTTVPSGFLSMRAMPGLFACLATSASAGRLRLLARCERAHPLFGGERGDGVGPPQPRKRTHDDEAREIDGRRARQFCDIGGLGHAAPPRTALASI
jgi:hypothetical protein